MPATGVARADDLFTEGCLRAIANEMVWSKQKAHDYANLSKICPDSWAIVVPTIRGSVQFRQDGDGTTAVPDGTAKMFTEGCLRAIIQLAGLRNERLNDAFRQCRNLLGTSGQLLVNSGVGEGGAVVFGRY
jgi:hypothetical protein